MKPNVYRPNGSPSSLARRERPQLRLIPGEGRRKRPLGPWLVVMSLLVAGLTAWMLSRPATKSTIAESALRKSLTDLGAIYHSEGMLTFLEAKARLKLQVADALQDSDSAVADLADNMAVFLFPDLLPDEDFEKSVALDEWQRAEAFIEGSPRSKQARARYQDLQAEIWQYESPDAKDPALSPVASEVLKLYQALSAP